MSQPAPPTPASVPSPTIDVRQDLIFVWPVVLAVTYTLLEAWIEDGIGQTVN